MAFLNAEYELRAARRVGIHPALVAVMLVLFCGGLSFAIEADQDFFEKDIRPLLVEKCWKCHGAEKQDDGIDILDKEQMARLKKLLERYDLNTDDSLKTSLGMMRYNKDD